MHAVLFPILLCSLAMTTSPSPPLLTIGSASPEFGPLTFVRGDAVEKLQAGTIYVVEFTGIHCVPCVKCIPHLNELQKKYPDVVFVGVYGQEEQEVRDFLTKGGKDIEIRVASNPNGTMWGSWMKPACQIGIPRAFIVGKDRKIAWIGDPAEMDTSLKLIVAGGSALRKDVEQLKARQEVILRKRRLKAREKQGRQAGYRIRQLVTAGKSVDALAATEKALLAFNDCPEATKALRYMQVWLLSNMAGKHDEAIQRATEWVQETKANGQLLDAFNLAQALLNVVERMKPESRDKRLIDLTLTLLREHPRTYPYERSKYCIHTDHIRSLEIMARAYSLRDDKAKALAHIQEAINLMKKTKPPADEKEYDEELRSELEKLSRQYSEKASTSSSDKR